MKQRGSSTIFGLFSSMLLSFLLIVFLYHHSTNLKKIKERSKLYLCAKGLYLAEEKLVNEMELLNLVIKNSTYLEMIKILFPPLAPLPAKEVKAGAQKIQTLLLISYSKKLLELKGKKCPLDYFSYRTPYKLQGLLLERKMNGESMLRTSSWENLLTGESFSLLLKLGINDSWKKTMKGEVWNVPMRRVTFF